MGLYVDSSALVKLIVEEPESAALRAFFANDPEAVASVLTRIETVRTLQRQGHNLAVLQSAMIILGRIGFLAIDTTIAQRAETVGSRELRSLDAIHLATALSTVHVNGIVTYDRRLGEAARAAGLTVWAPGAIT